MSAPPPAAAENGCVACSRVRPKRARALSLVSVSRMSSVTRPERPFVDALLTTIFSSARSPSRRKRGTYGRTIRSLTLRVSFWIEPAFRSFVTACTKTFQDVTESGTVNSIEAVPSAPVRRCGFQKAVSAKLLRRGTAASAGATLRALSSSLNPTSLRVRAAFAAGAEAGAAASATTISA